MTNDPDTPQINIGNCGASAGSSEIMTDGTSVSEQGIMHRMGISCTASAKQYKKGNL